MTHPSPSPQGYVALVLHGHLPFVRHPEHEHFLEENWFYEALLETYLPLLEVFEGLVRDQVPFRLTLSISPTLLSMCGDPLLQKRALRHLDLLLGLARKEKKRLAGEPAFSPVIGMYLSKLERYRRDLEEKYRGNVAEGFKRFQDLGHLEIITCGATHGYLPLLASREAAARAQVRTALEVHEEFFGNPSRGFWLPECGYQPGLESVFEGTPVRYTFVDSHGLLQAAPRPLAATFAPVRTSSGTVFFGRDALSSKQVWSSKEGYPGHPDYREFYRDAGFDLSEEELAPFLKPEGLRRFSGLKYFRVTGSGDGKEPYDPGKALERVREHARHFLDQRLQEARKVAPAMDRPPLMACLYDAELFGHWWYEGPEFLADLFRQNQAQGSPLDFITPSDYLERHPDLQTTQPGFSSWGLGGYSEVWLNPNNDWIYPALAEACDEMVRLSQLHPKARGTIQRALDQAARELLLAQASDWAFMLHTGNHAPYAEWRVKTHLTRFRLLQEGILHHSLEEGFLRELEGKDNLFPGLDHRVFLP
ncbi:MAG TPA: 1,4-alpha-glucan branching protein domain-containing protein [bacterium]|nr:1,4-alpha-glucan branching protein domain-containing protein [bacterium]